MNHLYYYYYYKFCFCFINLDSFNSLKSHHFFCIHVTSLDSTYIISIYKFN